MVHVMTHLRVHVIAHGQGGVEDAGHQIGFRVMDVGAIVFQVVKNVLDVMAVHIEKLFLHKA